MPLDPNIPLSAGQQVFDPMQKMGEAYQLAGMMEKQRQMTQQRQDHQIIQEALQGGANFSTPDGIAKAAEQLKGRVSPEAYEKMIGAHQEMKANETNQQIAMAKLSEAQLSMGMKQNDAILQQLQGGLAQYQEDVKKYGEQEATRRYTESKKQLIPQLAQQQMEPGQPMFPPQLLQKYATSNPNQDMAALEGVDYKQKQMKAATDLKLEQAQITEKLAAAKKLEKEAQLNKIGAVSPTGEVLHGDQYLAKLPENVQDTVKAIAEGRVDINSIPARTGERGQMLQMVEQYDPTFSAATYKTKSAVEKDFTVGKASQNITSINTAIGHMGTLDELGKALKNKDVQTVNALINRVRQETGNPNITNFNLAKTAVGEEMMRTFRGVGASVSEAEEWKSNFDTAQTPEQISSSIRTGVKLLQSRIGAMNEQYKRGTGNKQGYKDILDQESVDTLYDLTGKDYSTIYNVSKPTKLRGKTAEKTEGGKIPEFKTVAEAKAANLPPNTRVKIGGRTGTWTGKD